MTVENHPAVVESLKKTNTHYHIFCKAHLKIAAIGVPKRQPYSLVSEYVRRNSVWCWNLDVRDDWNHGLIPLLSYTPRAHRNSNLSHNSAYMRPLMTMRPSVCIIGTKYLLRTQIIMCSTSVCNMRLQCLLSWKLIPYWSSNELFSLTEVLCKTEVLCMLHTYTVRPPTMSSFGRDVWKIGTTWIKSTKEPWETVTRKASPWHLEKISFVCDNRPWENWSLRKTYPTLTIFLKLLS